MWTCILVVHLLFCGKGEGGDLWMKVLAGHFVYFASLTLEL